MHQNPILRKLITLSICIYLTCNIPLATADDLNKYGFGYRVFTFVNDASIPVWVLFNGGSIGKEKKGGGGLIPITCDITDPNSCPVGTHCETTGNPMCFWDHPTIDGKTIHEMTADDYRLFPGESKNFTIPIIRTNPDLNKILWSGAIAGRTRCRVNATDNHQILCDTANCPTGDVTSFGYANCLDYNATDHQKFYVVGSTPPFTKPEATFSNTGPLTHLKMLPKV